MQWNYYLKGEGIKLEIMPLDEINWIQITEESDQKISCKSQYWVLKLRRSSQRESAKQWEDSGDVFVTDLFVRVSDTFASYAMPVLKCLDTSIVVR